MPREREEAAPSAAGLRRLLAPLFWDRELEVQDLERHPRWVLARVLSYGNRAQVAAARRFFGDEAVRDAARHRSIDPRTRNFWRIVLGDDKRAPEGPPH